MKADTVPKSMLEAFTIPRLFDDSPGDAIQVRCACTWSHCIDDRVNRILDNIEDFLCPDIRFPDEECAGEIVEIAIGHRVELYQDWLSLDQAFCG